MRNSGLVLVLLTVVATGPFSMPVATAAEGPAVVQAHVPFEGAWFNRCTHETVTGSGFYTLVTQGSTPLGVHVNEFNIESFQGVSDTGARYVITHQTNGHGNFDVDGVPANSTSEFVEHVMRLGEDGSFVAGDDFYVRVTFQQVWNANGELTVNNFEFTTECH